MRCLLLMSILGLNNLLEKNIGYDKYDDDVENL